MRILADIDEGTSTTNIWASQLNKNLLGTAGRPAKKQSFPLSLTKTAFLPCITHNHNRRRHSFGLFSLVMPPIHVNNEIMIPLGLDLRFLYLILRWRFDMRFGAKKFKCFQLSRTCQTAPSGPRGRKGPSFGT